MRANSRVLFASVHLSSISTSLYPNFISRPRFQAMRVDDCPRGLLWHGPPSKFHAHACPHPKTIIHANRPLFHCGSRVHCYVNAFFDIFSGQYKKFEMLNHPAIYSALLKTSPWEPSTTKLTPSRNPGNRRHTRDPQHRKTLQRPMDFDLPMTSSGLTIVLIFSLKTEIPVGCGREV